MQNGLRVKVLGIDPGISGALVLTDGDRYIRCFEMPVTPGKLERRIPYGEVYELLRGMQKFGVTHVFLERAVSFGMGTKAAFNYGRGFEAVSLAVQSVGLPVTLVEPGKWTKEMHEGISANLKPKAKSAIAVDRLFPQLVGEIPRRPRGGVHDGFIDALLIAGYGLRKLGGRPTPGGGPENAVAVKRIESAPRHQSGSMKICDDPGDFY